MLPHIPHVYAKKLLSLRHSRCVLFLLINLFAPFLCYYYVKYWLWRTQTVKIAKKRTFYAHIFCTRSQLFSLITLCPCSMCCDYAAKIHSFPTLCPGAQYFTTKKKFFFFENFLVWIKEFFKNFLLKYTYFESCFYVHYAVGNCRVAVHRQRRIDNCSSAGLEDAETVSGKENPRTSNCCWIASADCWA